MDEKQGFEMVDKRDKEDMFQVVQFRVIWME